jgi:hypothetical protein
MAIIKRFYKTIWTKIKKYIASTGNFKFIHKIPMFIKNYNNSKHSSTKLKPIDIFQNNKIPLPAGMNTVVKTENSIKNESNDSIKVNDKVRIIVKRKTFTKKSFERIWSEDIYIIIGKRGNRYLLELNEKQVEKTYLKREMQKVTSVGNPTNISPEEKKTNKANKFVKLQRKENIGNVDQDIGVVKPENKRLVPSAVCWRVK